MDRRTGRAVSGGGGNGAGPASAGRAERGAPVIGFEALYGLGALIAMILFAYLVFALIRAEEF